jgi:uncharacterized protein
MVPGLGGSEPGHWQSLWLAAHPGAMRVEQADWFAPRRLAWTARLESAVCAAAGPVVLVAHSLAGPLVAHWARGGAVHRVRAALLVAPADVERPGAPEAVRDFAPLPRERLPFTSWVVASSDDPHATLARSRELAAAWGARFLHAGAVGHLNVASGHGPWPEGEVLLEALVRSAADRQGGRSGSVGPRRPTSEARPRPTRPVRVAGRR